MADRYFFDFNAFWAKTRRRRVKIEYFGSVLRGFWAKARRRRAKNTILEQHKWFWG